MSWRERLYDLGLDDRCQVTGGDFFESVPAGCDAYLLSHVLHDWPEDQALAIVATCREAMAPGARLLIVENVIADDDNGLDGKAFDLLPARHGGRALAPCRRICRIPGTGGFPDRADRAPPRLASPLSRQCRRDKGRVSEE